MTVPLPPPPLATGALSSPFVFNIAPLIGPEHAPGTGGPGRAAVPVQIPGLGQITPDQLLRAGQQMQQVVTQLSDGADLHKGATPAQLATASERLEAMHARGNLTEEQYQAFRALLDRMLAASQPGPPPV